MAIAGGSEFGTGSMPCQMQMDGLDQQLSPDDPPGSSHQKVPPVCPMMVGGLCVTLFAVTPVPASLPIPAESDVKAIRLDESVTPHVVSPPRRPPRSL